MKYIVAYIIYFQFLGGKETHGGYWMDISAQGIGFVGMLLNFIITLCSNPFFDKPSSDVQDMVEDMRIPV